jgi:hypothetical protein
VTGSARRGRPAADGAAGKYTREERGPRRSNAQASHRTRRKPCARTPHRGKAPFDEVGQPYRATERFRVSRGVKPARATNVAGALVLQAFAGPCRALRRRASAQFESPPLRLPDRVLTAAARFGPGIGPVFGSVSARIRARRSEQVELALVIPHPAGVVLVEHLEGRAAVLRHPLGLAAATERHRDERVASGVELPRDGRRCPRHV